MYRITVEGSFSSAHRLPSHDGLCRNLHGHNWIFQVTVGSQTLDENGMVMDFADLKRFMKKVTALLDHQYINEIKPFDEIPPTAENLAKWIFEKMTSEMHSHFSRKSVCKPAVMSVTIAETEHNTCEYSP